MPLSLLGMPTELLALILAACSIGNLPALAATSKLIRETSDERRRKIAVLKLRPFKTTPFAVVLDLSGKQLGDAGLQAYYEAALSNRMLAELETLNLDYKQIGDADLQAFCPVSVLAGSWGL